MEARRRLLLAYDLRPASRAALFTALEWAARLGAELHLVYVLPALARDAEARRTSAERALAIVVDAVSGQGCETTAHVVSHGGVVGGIVREAAVLKADLIAMGTHGRTGLRHLLLGSVAKRTVRAAPCPVLTVKRPEPAG